MIRDVLIVILFALFIMLALYVCMSFEREYIMSPIISVASPSTQYKAIAENVTTYNYLGWKMREFYDFSIVDNSDKYSSAIESITIWPSINESIFLFDRDHPNDFIQWSSDSQSATLKFDQRNITISLPAQTAK